MTKIFYVIKWILRSFLFLLLLDLVVESAVVAPNQKGYQDGIKLPEQRFLPETSPALYVEEEKLHAHELNQISRKRVKRGARSCNTPICGSRFILRWDCGETEKKNQKWIWLNISNCPSSRTSCNLESCQINLCKDNWMKTCKTKMKAKCRVITMSELDEECSNAYLTKVKPRPRRPVD